MTRFMVFGGARFVLAGALAFALAACFAGRAEAASVFSSSFAAPAVFVNHAAPGARVVAGDRALTLSWGSMKGAAAYRVSWRGRVLKGGKPTAAWSKKWLGLKVLKASARSYKAAGLVNGSEYQLRLESKAKAKKSLWVARSTPVASPKAVTPPPTPASAPGEPTGVAGVAGNASVVVSWLAPSSDGGSAITGYTVTASGGGSRTCTAATLSCTVTGLTNGTSYTFTAVATNARGDSVASVASAAATPATVPGALTSVSGVAGDASVVVSWLAPSSDGGSAVTGYTVTADGGGSQTCTAATSPCTVAGLTNGTAYTFTVKATNARGDSVASLASPPVTPFGVSGAPTGVAGVAGDASVVVSWLAPSSDGGSAVTGYTVTASDGVSPSTQQCAASPCTVAGLTNGTPYTFTAVATNARGDSVASAASAPVTPFGVPDAPTTVSGVAGDTQVVVSWLAPSSDGGSAVTGYTVTASDGVSPSTQQCAASPCTVTGLTNATAYTFTAVATNARGDSVASAASAAVTPTLSCSNGGDCVVGDAGPGGGKVFYAPGGTFTETSAACGSSCRYLEAAPVDWNSGGSPDPYLQWGGGYGYGNVCSRRTISGATGTGIGSGFANTAAIMAACPAASGTNSAPAARAASTYSPTVNGAAVNGWFLPSRDELYALDAFCFGLLYSNSSCWDGVGGTSLWAPYWSSSQSNLMNAWSRNVGRDGGDQWQGTALESENGDVRPVRAS